MTWFRESEDVLACHLRGRVPTLFLAAILAAAAPACSSESDTSATSAAASTNSVGSGGGGGSGNGGMGTAGGGASAAGGGGTGVAGTPTPTCVRACTAAADCVKPNAQPPFDDNNWVCEQNRCRWLGCLGDEECSFFGGVCRLGAVSNEPVKTCTEACTNGADVCAETLASVDADNWTCPDGGCKYIEIGRAHV